jgi:hypothetical protein
LKEACGKDAQLPNGLTLDNACPPKSVASPLNPR